MSGRGRSLRPGGVVRAMLRFFLLVALGFAAGLVIGIVSEEPELLAGHLRGESTSVTLSATADGAMEVVNPDAEFAASPPASPPTSTLTPVPIPTPAAAPARARTPETVPEHEPAAVLHAAPAAVAAQPARVTGRAVEREAKPPKVSAPPRVRAQAAVIHAQPRDAFAIQVGAFSDEKAAQGLARGLEQKGYPAAILPSAGSARRFRVRVQPLPNEAAAQAMADRLKRDEGLPTWVLQMEPGTDSGNGAR